MNNSIALLAGLLFGAGLAASGMTNTDKVLGFLDLTGAWQADLIFVMGAALLVTLIGFPLILKRKAPLISDQFYLSTKRAIDKPLIIGAIIFGIGWGIYGYCPGPAIAALSYLDINALIFVLSMAIGMAIASRLESRAKVE